MILERLNIAVLAAAAFLNALDAKLLAADVERFGDILGVRVHDLPSMSPAQVREILDGPGTIIGGFCESGACLSVFGK